MTCRENFAILKGVVKDDLTLPEGIIDVERETTP